MGHALFFAFDDETDRGALHAAGRQSTVHLAPEDRRDLVAVEAIEDSAGLGGVHQLVVHAAGIGECMLDGRLGDFVEDHPVHRHLGLEVLLEVGGDRLPLAVLVGCEIERVGVLEECLQFLDDRRPALGELVVGFETVLHVDRQPLAREVGDVADRGADVEAIAEIFGDRLRLGGGFNDDERVRHDFSSLRCGTLLCQGYRRKPKCTMGFDSVSSIGK